MFNVTRERSTGPTYRSAKVLQTIDREDLDYPGAEHQLLVEFIGKDSNTRSGKAIAIVTGDGTVNMDTGEWRKAIHNTSGNPDIANGSNTEELLRQAILEFDSTIPITNIHICCTSREESNS